MTTVLTRGRKVRRRRAIAVIVAASVLLAALSAVFFMVGNTFYPPADVWNALMGEDVPGASYTVVELRFPRLVLALVVGVCFGLAGAVFQTLLRNQLASPDIIGISSGAAAAGVVAIVIFRLPQSQVSMFALLGSLAVAGLIYALSLRKAQFAGTRLILVGIGISAILQSVVTYVLSRAAAWDLNTATRWLNGSLNGATWERIWPPLIGAAIIVPVLVYHMRDLQIMRLGDDVASALGVGVRRSRTVLVVGAVALVALATAASGPIAFVAFMSGPIAARLVRGSMPVPIPSALIGALLTVSADLVGQHLLSARYPVGVITGILGAPFLIYLLVRSYRGGFTS